MSWELISQRIHRAAILLLVFGVPSLFIQCATDKVALELTHYVNQDILNISELEQKSLQKYALVTGPNYTSNKKVYDTLKQEVIPVYKRFLTKLRDVSPKEVEVKKLHKFYICGAELLYGGFKTKMLGLETNDVFVMQAANEKIEKGRLETERWRMALDLLAERHGLKKRGK